MPRDDPHPPLAGPGTLDKLAFLARVSEVLSTSLDFDRVAAAVADLCVPQMGDWCLVDVVEGERDVRRVAASAADPAHLPLLAELQQRYPPSWDSPQPGPLAIRTGAPVPLPEIDAELISRHSYDEEHAALMHRLGIHSAVALPLVTQGRTVGALTLAFTARGRQLAGFDPQLAQELARRVAVALENARLYRELADREEQMRGAWELARQADRRKDEFLALLGHELRNPLAPILTALELLHRKDDGALGRELRILDRQVKHLKRLVDDLLDLSRITSGRLQLSLERVDLATVVGHALEMVAPLIEEREHHLDLDLPAGTLLLRGDPVRLAQVLANLLNNAARYTPRGGQVAVRARREGGEIVLTVRDSGKGIPQDVLPTLFEPFTQERQPPDRREGGLGLGLKLVQSLVELHGGSVTARSEGRDRGTEVEVRLPGRGAAGGVAAIAAGRPRQQGEALRILVVDDNRDAAEALAELLRLEGYQVVAAHEGRVALAMAAERPPDVALLDIGLPVMDGYELARRLRRQPSDHPLRLIALTGYGQEHDRRRSQAAGFDDHLVKPVDLATLRQALTGVPGAAGGSQLDVELPGADAAPPPRRAAAPATQDADDEPAADPSPPALTRDEEGEPLP
ncbi:MAG TPA: ATP-binding protein [Thermoanaerobaculia bacterium]|nr:ATP-binding protein [Thermoanaerobaculia bacterium]